MRQAFSKGLIWALGTFFFFSVLTQRKIQEASGRDILSLALLALAVGGAIFLTSWRESAWEKRQLKKKNKDSAT